MPCCADARGEEVYAGLKRAVDRAGLTGSVWVTRTGCLGFCNADGATVAIYPEGRFLVSVKPSEAAAVLEGALPPR
jgi:(2Fe-2S) ferredoxin